MLMKMSQFAWAFWRLVQATRGIGGLGARRLRGLWVKQWLWPRRVVERQRWP
jgi:hypothetical protein